MSADLQWPSANIPPSGPFTLLVDGFNSSSEEAGIEGVQGMAQTYGHLIYAYGPGPSAQPTVAFSYSGVGRRYVPEATHDLFGAAPKLIDYLPQDTLRAVVPVGASGGAIVVLLGVGEWIRRINADPPTIKTAIPRIILVAPALCVVARVFEKVFFSPHARIATPISALRLVQPGSRSSRNARKAITQACALIHWADIPIYVAQWAADGLTLAEWDPDVRRIVEPVKKRINVDLDDPILPNSALRTVRGHLEFLRNPATVRQVTTWATLKKSTGSASR